MFHETEESHQEEKYAGQDPPKGSSGEALHDLWVTIAIQIHPDKDKGAGKRHDADQTGSGRHFLPYRRGG